MIPVVLDVDTGVDDAFALLLAARHPGLDLRAVSCVAGNADVDQVVRNTLTVLGIAGRDDVPVARGAERPLLEPARSARHVHGEDGMGDLGLPAPSLEADPRHGVELLRDVLLAAADAGEPVTLVPLAPLTNIALLLRSHPRVAAGLDRIVFMGGAARAGNATAAAEFNVWHDPEAAAIVLDAASALGIPVTMYGLDVFNDVRVSRSQATDLMATDLIATDLMATDSMATDLEAIGSAAARLAGALVDFQCRRFGTDDTTVGDAGAVCAVLDPGGITTQRLPVRVELSGTWTRGQTVVDQRPGSWDRAHDPHGPAPAVIDVDGERYARLWLDALRPVA